MLDSQSPPRRRYLVGVLALLAVVFIWVTSSFVMNSIFADLEYNKPFFVTYINTATFSLYMIPFLHKKKTKQSAPENLTLEIEASLLANQESEIEEVRIIQPMLAWHTQVSPAVQFFHQCQA
ncbi:hypothetical protein BDF20DRAFT_888294 [Mycotypha africana]|uniref:uncharacterized protein n=1 Tax=Mycotypha africana TaxID=64632 RepID=UPI00230030C8|nr:uncharacterized protein BDF20DRAFT_888294 [Mycotypha africana]KAI8972061.1 hypothetical protein BDF20DRAFT_888294 [Mycotypha africana]